MKEIRSIEKSEFRIDSKSRKIEGYALLFNTESQDLGGFREVIKPEAMNGVLEKSDILALYNHLDDKVLARSTKGKGTLTLNVDDKGLRYSFEAPKTALGDEVYDAIKRGDLRNSSFAFTVDADGQKWEKRDGQHIRNIIQFDELYDCSPVYRPAYLDTVVAARSLKKIIEMEKREVDEDGYLIDENGEFILDEDGNKQKEEVEEPVEEKVEPPIEDEEDEEEVEEKVEEKPTEEPDPEQEEDVEYIDVVYDGETISIPKSIIEEYIDSTRKFNEYYSKIETSIVELKK